MKRRSGITADTFRRLAKDAGAIYLNYGESGQVLLGATRGGNAFNLEPEVRKMDVDGTPGDVKGDKRFTGGSFKLTANVIEMSPTVLAAALPGYTMDTDSTHNIFTREDQIDDGDYFTNVAIVLDKTATDAPIAFIVKNAIALGPFNFSANEKDEGVIPIEFTGHYDPSDIETEPWEIRDPITSTTVFRTLTYIAGSNGAIAGNTSQTVANGADGSLVYAYPLNAATHEFDKWSDNDSTDPARQDLDVSGNITATALFTTI